MPYQRNQHTTAVKTSDLVARILMGESPKEAAYKLGLGEDTARMRLLNAGLRKVFVTEEEMELLKANRAKQSLCT